MALLDKGGCVMGVEAGTVAGEVMPGIALPCAGGFVARSISLHLSRAGQWWAVAAVMTGRLCVLSVAASGDKGAL